MAKVPYPTRLDEGLLKEIKKQAKNRNRSVNNMIEVLCQYGLQYLDESSVEPEIIKQSIKIENKLVKESNALS